MMKAGIQNEILDILKQRLLPELGEIRRDLDEFRIETRAELKVINGRLDEMDKRFEQIDKRFEQVDKRFEQVDKRFEQMDKRLDLMDRHMDQMTDEMRELRAYAFAEKMGSATYTVRDRPSK